MTQQYLAGELSLLLGRLVESLSGEGPVDELVRLRRRVESAPLPALACVARSALEACDRACWASLAEGDVDAFARRATICSEIGEFASCAGLLAERRHPF